VPLIAIYAPALQPRGFVIVFEGNGWRGLSTRGELMEPAVLAKREQREEKETGLQALVISVGYE
jgi:hypothetical protein